MFKKVIKIDPHVFIPHLLGDTDTMVTLLQEQHELRKQHRYPQKAKDLDLIRNEEDLLSFLREDNREQKNSSTEH